MYIENVMNLFIAGVITTTGLVYYISIIIKKFKTI